MISIDGTVGGGQLLRTALSLATITATPFRIDDIRNSRPVPGLRAQHLAAVTLAGELCDATVTGATLGSETLTFEPGDDRRTRLEADIGTAGSVTLLFDTVLPIATSYEAPFELTATGGTNVKWAPTIDYHRHVKLPLLSSVGVQADIDLVKHGFYPAGGGEARLRVAPAPLSTFELQTRGELHRVDVYSNATTDLEDRQVADRQADHATERLEEIGADPNVESVEYVEAESTGSSLLLTGVYEHTMAGFNALGERGRTAEAVAERACEEFSAFHATEGVVDVHMADQLMVFLAIAGGTIRIPTVSDHVRTNLEVVNAFGSDMEIVREGAGPTLSAAGGFGGPPSDRQ